MSTFYLPAFVSFLMPVRAAREFYGTVLRCEEGRSSKTWIDWNLCGHQLVTHFASTSYKGVDYFNGVDAVSESSPFFFCCWDWLFYVAVLRNQSLYGVK